jgi:hypothetical protein
MTMNKIYKIEFDNYIYYGSTKQLLCKRQSRHNYNLRNNYKQKLYQIANKNNIEKLNCILLEECEEIERYYIENKYIKNNNDKIILNDRLAFANEERKKETNKNYRHSEKGKIQKKIADKRYSDKHREKVLENKRMYYWNNKENNIFTINPNLFQLESFLIVGN